MRPIAFVTRAFAGCRAKMHAVVEQIFGPDSVDVYRFAHAPSDTEFMRTDADHCYQKNPAEFLDEILKHEYIHAFCDNCGLLKDLSESGVPFIAHQHDIYSMRAPDYFEPFLHLNPLAISVFTSKAHRDYMCTRWGLPENSTHLIYNYPVLAWQPEIPKPPYKIPGSVVYFGGIVVIPTAHTGYRFYSPEWQMLAEAGIQVHCYTHGSISPAVLAAYSHPNIFLHHCVDHKKLYEELAKYEVGFAGYNNLRGVPEASRRFCVTCHPNKAYDYMFAGIPTMAYNLGEASWLVNQWGAATSRPDRIVETFMAAKSKKWDYEGMRKKYSMEAQKPRIEELYQKVRRAPHA